MSHLSDPVILVIDSDPIALASFRTALGCESYVVHTADDPTSALDLAERFLLDLVITDIQVGNAHGVDIYDAIRKIPGREDVPVMFAAKNQLPDVIRRAHEFGPAFHLRKPVNPRVLLELVSRALWMPHLVTNHLAQRKIPKPHLPMPGMVGRTMTTRTDNFAL